MLTELKRRHARLRAWGSGFGCAAVALFFPTLYVLFKSGLRVDTSEITLLYLMLGSALAAGALLDRCEAVRLKLVYALAEIDARPSILVLRSFTASTLTIGSIVRHRRGPSQYRDTFIDVLTRGAQSFGILVALGIPPKELSTAELEQILFLSFDDAEWFAAFLVAARAARMILLVPDITASAAREIVAVRDHGMLDKTIVAMPPTLPERSAWDFVEVFRRVDLRNRWEVVRDVWRQKSVHLPPYQESGMLYVPGANFAPRVVVELDANTTVQTVHAALDTLLQHIPDGGTSTRHLLESLRQFGFRN